MPSLKLVRSYDDEEPVYMAHGRDIWLCRVEGNAIYRMAKDPLDHAGHTFRVVPYSSTVSAERCGGTIFMYPKENNSGWVCAGQTAEEVLDTLRWLQNQSPGTTTWRIYPSVERHIADAIMAAFPGSTYTREPPF